MVNDSFQNFDGRERYIHPKNRSVSFQKPQKFCSVFIILKCSQDAILKMCRLEIRFENLPANNAPYGRPIRHNFHCFQNVFASC